MRHFILSSFILLCLNVSDVFAQNDTTKLAEVVLKTTTRAAEQSAQISNKLTSKNFLEVPQQNFTAVIQKLPGIHLQQGALNTTKINVRGVGARAQFQTNRLKMYFNFIPISTANGTSTLDDFDVLMLDGLQLTRGPKSTTEGASLGGVLNLKSTPSLTTTAFTQQLFGSNGYYKQHYQAESNLGQTQYKVAYNNLSYGGFRANSNYQRESYLINTNTRLNRQHQLKFLAHGVGLKAFIPSSLNQTDLNESPESAAFTWNAARGYEHYTKAILGLTLESNWSENFKQTTALFYNYTDANEPRPFNILKNQISGIGSRHLTEWSFISFGLNSKLQFGGEFQTEQVEVSTFENLYEDFNQGSVQGDVLSSFDQNRYYIEGFATYQLQFNSMFNVNLGLAVNQTGFEQDNLLESVNSNFTYDFGVLPSISAMYHFNTNYSLEVSVSKGISVPTLEESLTEQGLFNKDLKPEEAWQYELVFSSTPFTWLTTSLKAYYIDVNNLIVARRVAEDQFVGINAGSTNHPGLEASLAGNFSLTNSLKLNVFANASFNFYSFDQFVDGTQDFSENNLTGVPDRLLNVGLNLDYKAFNLSWNTNMVSRLPVNDANTVYTNSYAVSHLNMSYKFQLTSHLSLGVQGGIQNLFNETYTASVVTNAVGFGGSQPRYFYPGEPRQWFGGLRLNYLF